MGVHTNMSVVHEATSLHNRLITNNNTSSAISILRNTENVYKRLFLISVHILTELNESAFSLQISHLSKSDVLRVTYQTELGLHRI